MQPESTLYELHSEIVVHTTNTDRKFYTFFNIIRVGLQTSVYMAVIGLQNLLHLIVSVKILITRQP